MSTRAKGLRCSKTPVGECGNIRPASHGDKIEWCLEIHNPGPAGIKFNLTDDPATMPELIPALSWTFEETGGVTGASAGAGVLSDDLVMPPVSSIKYFIIGTVRDDALCPSWVVNTSTLTLETTALGKPEVLKKRICSDPVPVGTDDVDWEIYPCDPKTINIDEHAWQFFGGGEYAEHAILTQLLAEGMTLAGLLLMVKELAPAAYEKYACRQSTRPDDNLQWPPQDVLTSTAVIGQGPPFEGPPPGGEENP